MSIDRIRADCPLFGFGIDSPTKVYVNGVPAKTNAAVPGRYAYSEYIAGRSNSTATVTNATDTIVIAAGQYSCP